MDIPVVMILQYAAIAILFFEFIFVSMQKPSELQKHAIVLTLSAIFMFVGYCIELTAASVEVALIGTGVSYIGKPYIMLSSFLFICSFYHKKISDKVVALLAVLCSFFSVLVFSNERHHLYYATVGFQGDAPFSPLILSRGPLYYSYVIFAVAYFIACLTVIFTRSKFLRDKQSRRLNTYIALMIISGIGGYVVFLSGLSGSYDATMAGVFISVICLFLLFVRCRIFDAVVLGKDKALEDSTTGLVIPCVIGLFRRDLMIKTDKAKHCFIGIHSRFAAFVKFKRPETDIGLRQDVGRKRNSTQQTALLLTIFFRYIDKAERRMVRVDPADDLNPVILFLIAGNISEKM